MAVVITSVRTVLEPYMGAGCMTAPDKLTDTLTELRQESLISHMSCTKLSKGLNRSAHHTSAAEKVSDLPQVVIGLHQVSWPDIQQTAQLHAEDHLSGIGNSMPVVMLMTCMGAFTNSVCKDDMRMQPHTSTAHQLHIKQRKASATVSGCSRAQHKQLRTSVM